MVYGDLLGERARLTPDRTALVWVPEGTRFTYAELDARAVRCARVLREALGLAVDDRVALLADNRVEYLDLFFAAPKAGVILVPLGTRLTPSELAGILEDAAPAAFFYGSEHAETVKALRSLERPASPEPSPPAPLPQAVEGRKAEDEEGVPPRPSGREGVWERGPGGEGSGEAGFGGLHWIALDEGVKADSADSTLSDLITRLGGGSPLLLRGGGAGGGGRTPEDLHCLLYTSGTTGRPKGVMIPHRQVIWNGYNTVVGWQLRADDVSPVFTPLYHAGGLAAFLVPVFTIGGTVVLHRAFDASEVWRTIEAERCTVVLGVPTIWKMLLEAPEWATVDLSHVRWLISGGAPLPQYIIEAYQQRGVVFKQGYGMTEVGVNCFAMTVEESVARAGSIGKPLMFTETRLADEQGGEVPPGEVGELWIRGPHVCRGYWKNPEATAAALDADGWFHTGDLARRDAEGFHWIAGRKKDMIISGGVNVYPAEIEGELLLHPDVRDAAVVGVPHPTWGEVGIAFVVPRGGDPDRLAEELSSFLAGRLAKYKIPREFRFVDALPRTAYGKVVKGELRQKVLEGR